MNLTKREIVKSLIVAVLGAILTAVLASLTAGHWPTTDEWHVALRGGAVALISAILTFMGINSETDAKKQLSDLNPDKDTISFKNTNTEIRKT